MTAATGAPASAPARAGLVLAALIGSAFVSNLNLAAAGVAMPDIGDAFGASQIALNLVAVGTGLGLSMSVVYFGALADRYGRKQLLMLGLMLMVVASALSAFAPSMEVLIGARIFTGLSAGLAFPTTLSLITALWAQGPKRTAAIALWSAVAGMASIIGGILSGLLLLAFWWGSAFLLSVPLALIALALVATSVPAHVNESTSPVDHLGGALSALGIASLVLGISMVFDPGQEMLGTVLLIAAVVFLLLFGWRQLRAPEPLYDLAVARRRTFWAPAVVGLIVFGSFIGAMYVGQQYMQNVLGYSALEAGLAVAPAALGLLVAAPLAARLVVARGSRVSMTLGCVLVLAAFCFMLFWREDTVYVVIGAPFMLVGAGASFVLTAASRSLTSTAPVRRVGMASATSDLQSDLGGSLMQSLLGALLAAGFAAHFGRLIAASSEASTISADVTSALQSSYASALQVAEQYPQFHDAIVSAARESLVTGAFGAYIVGAVAIVLGMLVALFAVPPHRREQELLAQYEER